jgi:DNA-binding LacI/PurR family transcriptional regulator
MAQGHHDIVCLCNLDDASTVLERVAGYRDAFAECGFAVREDRIVRNELDPGESERDGMERLLLRLDQTEPKPTAFFCINDQLALLAHDVLESWGRVIPRDVSLIGFDGMLRWLPGGGNITTMVQDFERVGEQAARLLLERIDAGEPPRAYRHILLDAPLSLHGSAAPPRELVRSPSEPVSRLG